MSILFTSRRFSSACFALGGALLGAATLGAQTSANPALLVAATGDSVRILLTDSPPSFAGFLVYRTAPGAQPQRLTPEPVRRVRDPSLAAAIIGADLPAVMAAVQAREPAEMLRRLEADDFVGDIMSMLYPSVAHVLGRFWVDTAATRGATYTYRVVFTNARGEETSQVASERVVVTNVVPAPPPSVRATPGDRGVQLSWSYPPWRAGPRDLVIGFHVYRSDDTAPFRRITAGPVLRDDAVPMTYIDSTVQNGVRYRYVMRAVDVARRESVPTAAVSAVPVDRTRPALATALAAEPGDGRVRLTWRVAPEPDVAGYHLERTVGLDQPYRRLTTAPIPVARPLYDDTTVAGGTQYFYRVMVVDKNGNTSLPSSAISALPVDKTPPLPPSRVSVRAANRRLTMQWTASPSSDVLGYYIYRGDSPERLVRLVIQPVTGTSFVDSGYAEAGLSPGGRYTIHVAAVDRSYNESVPVAAEIAVPDDEPPAPPTGFQARNALGRAVEITWSASPSVDVAAYVLTRVETAPDARSASAGPMAARSDTVRLPGGGRLRDTLVAPGRRYVYALVAIDSARNRSGPAVDTVEFRDLAPPPTPRHATAMLTATGVQVNWERVVEPGLLGYHVYRSAIPTGVFERVTTTPVTGTMFVDATGRAEMYYTVRAVDESANESRPSVAVRPIAAPLERRPNQW